MKSPVGDLPSTRDAVWVGTVLSTRGRPESVTMLVLIILAVVWAAVLVPPMIRNRRDARPDNSVVSFRAQLSTLERATPGTSLRSPTSSLSAPMLPLRMTRAEVQQRRRQVLMTLGGATTVTLLMAIAGGTVFLLLFLLTAAAFGTYVYALVQTNRRAQERRMKVRVLMPGAQGQASPALRRTASN